MRPRSRQRLSMRSRLFAAAVLCVAAGAPPAFSQSAAAPQVSRPLPPLPAVACPRGPITYEGGDGSSKEKAVFVKGAPTGFVGIRAEYDWLNQNYPGYKAKISISTLDGVKSY